MYKKYADFLLEKAINDSENRDTYFEIIKVLLSQSNVWSAVYNRPNYGYTVNELTSHSQDEFKCSNTQETGTNIGICKSENGTNPRRRETYAV